MSGRVLDESADARSRAGRAIIDRQASPAASLGRIAAAVERVSPPPVEGKLEPGEFEPTLGLMIAALRSCPDPDLIVRVPARFFEAVDLVAVVRCPCEWVPVVPQGWMTCEGCGRGYLWTGSALFAVKATELDLQDRCDHRDFVAVEGSRPRCERCGISA